MSKNNDLKVLDLSDIIFAVILGVLIVLLIGGTILALYTATIMEPESVQTEPLSTVEYLEDIILHYREEAFEIKYFPAEVEMETPRLEEYEFSVHVCKKCGALSNIIGMPQKMYKFYIPKGTYFISH